MAGVTVPRGVGRTRGREETEQRASMVLEGRDDGTKTKRKKCVSAAYLTEGGASEEENAKENSSAQSSGLRGERKVKRGVRCGELRKDGPSRPWGRDDGQ